jgi:hypothetical protein
MWPFTKKPRSLKFKVGDSVFFRVLHGGRLYAGTVKAVNPECAEPYVVSPDLLPNDYADTTEALMRSRPPQTGGGA